MEKRFSSKKIAILAAVIIFLAAVVAAFFLFFPFEEEPPVETEPSRQFFWNSDIIDAEKTTATLTAHEPVRQNLALTLDSPWESGTAAGFHVVPCDTGWRLYYTVHDGPESAKICCAQSRDGISWEKPQLELVEYAGSTANNIVLGADRGLAGGLFAFKDTNPAVDAAEQYKAIGVTADGRLERYVSGDGLQWLVKGKLKKALRADAQPNAGVTAVFWNAGRQKYYCYYIAQGSDGQTVMLTTSKNFKRWSKPEPVAYSAAGENISVASASILPYYREETMLVGLPLRAVTLSQTDLAANFSTEKRSDNKLSDTVFAYGTDLLHFDLSQQAWLTPGPQTSENWMYGDCCVASGIVQTPSLHAQQGQDDQMSVYVAENMPAGTVGLTRYTARIDGFSSYSAPYNTQKVVTKPLVFDGSRMTLNFSTSTEGYVYVRILNENGEPFEDVSYTDWQGTQYTVPAYTSYRMVGDRVDREVAFNADLSQLAGQPVVLEFYLSDAHIYSFHFDSEPYENSAQWQPQTIELRSCDEVSYAAEQPVIDIGTERQLFVDDYIIDTANTDAALTAHSPVMKEEVFKTDLPWEGDNCDFYVILDDVDADGQAYYRMYYLGWDSVNPTDIRVCYACSYDGSNWEKPSLGLHTYTDQATGEVYTDTNIILYTEEEIFDNFFVTKDTRPNVPDSQRYKAICQGRLDQLGFPSFGLWAWQSPDGLHWTKTHRVLPHQEEWFGAFDSVNTLVWDETTQQFFTYFRVRESQLIDGVDYVDFRKIYGATAPDFVPFDTQTLFSLNYGENSPLFEMYTNNISKYHRAPQLFIGFPTRFSRHSVWEKNYEYLTDPQARLEKVNAGQVTKTLSMTDTLFMTSRDGYLWNRQNEAFFTPGPEYQANWIYGNCYPAYGLIETQSDIPGADRQLSTYLFEGKFYHEPSVLYRYVFRLDGFVSYQGTLAPQTVTTKPLTFAGSRLFINFATSAAGSVTVNILDENDSPLQGFTARLIGDNTDREVVFEGDLSQLAGRTVKLQFVLSDSQIYSFKFE